MIVNLNGVNENDLKQFKLFCRMFLFVELLFVEE